MAIKQVIEFHSKNRYFAGFLQNIINESEIDGSVEQNDTHITLLLDDKDGQKLEKFSALADKYLPHSMFLRDIKTTQEDIQIKKSDFKSDTYNIGLCPKCLEMLRDPASEDYLNDDIRCTHYANEAKYFNDITFFTPHYTLGCVVLLADASKVDELFILTLEEKEILFSIEKPTIKVTIKDEELKAITGQNYICVKAPYNVRSTLAALNAKDSEIPYLFFQNNYDLDVIKVQKNTTIIRASRVAKEITGSLEDGVLNRFESIAKEAEFELDALAVNMSLKHGISFLYTSADKTDYALKFQQFDLKNMLKNMQENDTQSKLINNFTKNYPAIMQELDEHSDYDLFESICCILELDKKSFEALSDKSLEFRGNGGLKVDTFFKEEGFDYESFMGSIMSFKLAGVEQHYLAYSIFEAFGDMIVSVLNQLKTKHKCHNFIMMGSMFENSVLYSRILTKLQYSNPYFAKAIALDD
ncbi:MAG: hydrogenase [Epsilonproteobacteria bacterium]|nr:hydrogenase [Campylobacterota bacterium]